ncbi:hypothetical protein H0H93_008745 [Arthromyces matolae]|nr:hypothetical protein H0H93_008745 [Arthromyces matolae]
MSVLRPFKASDMFKFNNIHLDRNRESAEASFLHTILSLEIFKYGIGFYLNYLARWPDLCCVQEAPSGRMMGYGMFELFILASLAFRPDSSSKVIGKAEGSNTEWHGHVTAITVAPEYRRLGLARKMMSLLEMVSDEIYRGFFVDLYVRCANSVAIEMYEGMGYSVYRRVREYYGNLGLGKGGRDEEDAFDMRKPMSRDVKRRSVRTNGREMIVSAHDVP